MAGPGAETLETSGSSRQPKTRQRIHRSPPVLSVPDINDDASERKRVLNVLAQRRYRQRKRQRRLGAASSSESSSAPGEDPDSSQASSVTGPHDSAREAEVSEPTSSSQESSDSLQAAAVVSYEPPLLDLDLQVAWPDDELESIIPNLLNGEGGVPDPPIIVGFLPPVPDLAGLEHTADIDPAVLLSITAEAPLLGDISPISFLDTYMLPVPELKLLQAFIRIARCFESESAMWDLNATSRFNDPEGPAQIASLPPSWAPTLSQRTIQHHPLLDFLPWPSARDRLIAIFDLPDDVRPAGAAGGPLALAQLVYDMEDSAEGVRIWGRTPCDSTAWEIGQVIFERWWFVFDRQIVEQSNHWRSLRGAPKLRLGDPARRVQQVAA